MEIDSSLNALFWLKVAISVGCGFIFGIERQLRGKPVGIRTSCMICLGTMAFIHLGLMQSKQDADHIRLLGQIVTGVGFLGGGVIFTQGGLVNGVTSAAVIWLLTAVGAAIGFGHFGVPIALSFIGVGILWGVQVLERGFRGLRRGVHSVRVQKEDVK
ncbi:MAG: MgtC/SapB family protein [Pseudobdellovibrionaceae bacterium]|uniref:MgtC/SapB family protein n=1 Tax=Oligoflexus sp. TaxID=1971216 RepID=UPI0027CBE120|nr:MgtC/SapB family protein [Oligoflexus sp.]MDQ3232764.1 MgtC/SapB family protein [Pseudobdellovibrionaceae bacterium]HYX38749.1 MgtC/SapB family protein [Oligoflexus sp.]